MSFWERRELDDPEEHLRVTSSVSVLSPPLHGDLTLNCDGPGGPLADLPCGKGCSFTSQSIWLSPPKFAM